MLARWRRTDRAAVKLQFEVWPQTRRIAHHRERAGEIMKSRDNNSDLVQVLLALRSRLGRYHPERHYMRGPGPKTLGKLGEVYRGETESDVRERIPEQWLTLVESIALRGRGR
jgi:hypothetical protein